MEKFFETWNNRGLKFAVAEQPLINQVIVILSSLIWVQKFYNKYFAGSLKKGAFMLIGMNAFFLVFMSLVQDYHALQGNTQFVFKSIRVLPHTGIGIIDQLLTATLLLSIFCIASLLFACIEYGSAFGIKGSLAMFVRYWLWRATGYIIFALFFSITGPDGLSELIKFTRDLEVMKWPIVYSFMILGIVIGFRFFWGPYIIFRKVHELGHMASLRYFPAYILLYALMLGYDKFSQIN